MEFKKFSRLYHTVRYLKLKQIVFRLYYRFARVRPREYQNIASRSWASRWSPATWASLSTDDAVEFTFLGVKGRVHTPADWQDGQHSKLWLYNLHYLDDLNAGGIESRPALAIMLIKNWMEANPPASGEGWEPYPLSLRIVNLVKWLACVDEDEDEGAHNDSLAVQVDALAQQVEYHILGNHLFANGKALVFAGVYLSGPMADHWLTKGLHILDDEISEQFLGDGGHFELSPMYHATLLWDMCDLVNLAQCSALPAMTERLPQWNEVVVRGLKWLSSMLHPDGRISFFNDSAFGVAPEYEQIKAYAERLGISLAEQEQQIATLNLATGYAVVAPTDGVKALLDLAQVGVSYQPGHAHADTLSFELSVFGRRLVVNSGTSQYGEGIERQRQRSTSAHSTVEVAAQDSSEVWAGFRVARRAKSVVERFERQPFSTCIQASHDGYRRLGGNQRHRRIWKFTCDGMDMIDEITGEPCVAVSRIYIHPDVILTQHVNGFLADMGGGGKVSIDFSGADQVRMVSSTWHPEFGRSLTNYCIEAVFSSGPLTTRILWS